CVQSLEYPLTF
nr:immunoglobulin light chain junction region [Macaca mulatta]MOV92969.1 immunoglobulin light chain junction region [Macaca mulatta]MOV93026.1 immunoglobulin light chain junction region [Macaca mulatta]MOV93404.1 immunoglobulin light chain junction region [Macaca mulatta]MOV93687.1 immunoglobulin light chain junction region [Macaca mulatta]